MREGGRGIKARAAQRRNAARREETREDTLVGSTGKKPKNSTRVRTCMRRKDAPACQTLLRRSRSTVTPMAKGKGKEKKGKGEKGMRANLDLGQYAENQKDKRKNIDCKET